MKPIILKQLPAGQILVQTSKKILLFLLLVGGISLGLLLMLTSDDLHNAVIAQENIEIITEPETTDPEPPPDQPEPQTPLEVGSTYNEQMTLEEVIAECHAGAERITTEFQRLSDNIQPYEISHPQYYTAETEKIDLWLIQTNTSHEIECEAQKDAAIARQTPLSQIPNEIETNYRDDMNLEEIEIECANVNQRIADELQRLLANLQAFQDSHPQYYVTEREKIEAWHQDILDSSSAECQRRQDALPEPIQDVDEAYPYIAQAIKDWANELQLTDAGKIILYDNNPQLFDSPNDPDYTCNDNVLSEIYIFGCWNPRPSIKVLKDNSTGTTLAHELLHAVYYEYYISEASQNINEMIDDATTYNPEQTQLILEAYEDKIQDLSPALVHYIQYTELYAFVGTQFDDIPPSLEEHYALYFQDRRVIVGIFHDWVIDTRAKIQKQENANLQLLEQVEEYQQCLNDEQTASADCQQYLPDEEQYLSYDQCLASRKTFLRDCAHLRLPPVLAYVPAPVISEPTNNPPAGEDDEKDEEDQQQAQELIDRTKQRQEETENSFINQLTSQEHEHINDNESPGVNDSNDDPAGEDDNESDTENEDEESNNEAENSDEPSEERQEIALVGSGSSNNDLGSAKQSTFDKNVAQKNDSSWLLFSLLTLSALVAVLIIFLILKMRNQPPAKLQTAQRAFKQLPEIPEIIRLNLTHTISADNESAPSASERLQAGFLADSLFRDWAQAKIVDKETCEFMEEMEFEDALAYAYGILLDAGRDPDAYLIKLGVLEADESPPETEDVI